MQENFSRKCWRITTIIRTLTKNFYVAEVFLLCLDMKELNDNDISFPEGEVINHKTYELDFNNASFLGVGNAGVENDDWFKYMLRQDNKSKIKTSLKIDISEPLKPLKGP